MTLVGGYCGYKSNASTYQLKGCNVGLGTYCLHETGGNSAGNENVAIGDYAFSYNEGTFVSRNTAIGFEAMRGMQSGDKYMNVALGWRSGKGAGAYDHCLYLGCEVGKTNNPSNNGYSNRIMIGNQDHVLLDGLCDSAINSFLNVRGKIIVDSGHLQIGDQASTTQTAITRIDMNMPYVSGQDVISQIQSKGKASASDSTATYSEIRTAIHDVNDGEFHIKVMRNGTLENVISINENGDINSQFKINAGKIEILGTLPLQYDDDYPKRIWSDQGVLRVGSNL